MLLRKRKREFKEEEEESVRTKRPKFDINNKFFRCMCIRLICKFFDDIKEESIQYTHTDNVVSFVMPSPNRMWVSDLVSIARKCGDQFKLKSAAVNGDGILAWSIEQVATFQGCTMPLPQLEHKGRLRAILPMIKNRCTTLHPGTPIGVDWPVKPDDTRTYHHVTDSLVPGEGNIDLFTNQISHVESLLTKEGKWFICF